MHWRHADETNETVSQRRARQADLAAQVIDGPTPGDIAVQERQCPSNVWLAQTGEPSRLTVRQRLCVTPHGFQEQQLRKLCEHGRGSWPAGGDLRCPVLEC